MATHGSDHMESGSEKESTNALENRPNVDIYTGDDLRANIGLSEYLESKQAGLTLVRLFLKLNNCTSEVTSALS